MLSKKNTDKINVVTKAREDYEFKEERSYVKSCFEESEL